MYPDPVMQEVTHFCLPGLLPILKNTVQFVHEVVFQVPFSIACSFASMLYTCDRKMF